MGWRVSIWGRGDKPKSLLVFLREQLYRIARLNGLHPTGFSNIEDTTTEEAMRRRIREHARDLLRLYKDGRFPEHEMFEDGVQELCRWVREYTKWPRS